MNVAVVALAAFFQVGVGPDADSVALTRIRERVPPLMSENGIPGTVITLVREGRVVLNQGFGLANVEDSIAVDADRTVFRTASVSKVFTALAVLRLVRSGTLDLQADVRRWVPALRARWPVSLHALLTHTSGYDDRDLGYLNPVGASPASLSDIIAVMPRQSRAPADVPGYSNYGYALAGLVVERASGLSFDKYVRDSLLVPMGLVHSSFIMSPGPGSPEGLAMEYRSDGSRRIQRSSKPYPAGNLGTTGSDMARFLQQLNDPDVRALFTPRLSYHPAMPPMGYGLAAVVIGGRTVWMKGGDSPSHSAVIAIVPELNLGLFIALNRQEPRFWEPLVEEIVGAYADEERDVRPDSVTPVSAAVEGDYRWTRAPLSNVAKMLGLAVQVRVRRAPAGLSISGFELLAGAWTHRGNLMFENERGRRLAFRVDTSGMISHGFTIVGGQPVSVERIPWFSTTRGQLSVLSFALLVTLVAGVTAGVRWRRSTIPFWVRLARVALVVLLIGIGATAVATARQADQLVAGPTTMLYACLVLTTLAGCAALMNVVGAMTIAVRTGGASSRTLNVLAAAGAGGVFWFLFTNNLIGLHL